MLLSEEPPKLLIYQEMDFRRGEGQENPRRGPAAKARIYSHLSRILMELYLSEWLNSKMRLILAGQCGAQGLTAYS